MSKFTGSLNNLRSSVRQEDNIRLNSIEHGFPNDTTMNAQVLKTEAVVGDDESDFSVQKS